MCGFGDRVPLVQAGFELTVQTKKMTPDILILLPPLPSAEMTGMCHDAWWTWGVLGSSFGYADSDAKS